MEKIAAVPIVTAAGNSIAAAVPKFVGAIGKAFLPTKPGASIGEKALGMTAKGGAVAAGLAGVYLGAKGVSSRVTNASGANYTTMIRNNVVAGNIDPRELSTADRAAISQLHFKRPPVNNGEQ